MLNDVSLVTKQKLLQLSWETLAPQQYLHFDHHLLQSLENWYNEEDLWKTAKVMHSSSLLRNTKMLQEGGILKASDSGEYVV